MAKSRDKNDSTMDISASQLVSGNRPQPPGVNKNDVSMWIGGVVGADEFSGSKQRPKKKSRAPLAIGLVALLAAAGGGAYYMFGRPSSSPSAGPAPVMIADAPIAVPVDAGEVDAAALPMPADAAVADASVPLAADAISGADPKHKTTTKKKKVVKKPVVKKKPATTKRR